MVIDDHIDGTRQSTRHAPQAARTRTRRWCCEVRSLAKSFWLREGVFGKREFKAVQDVNFQLRKGHTLGVVGESGSGKTTMGLTLLRLHEPTGGEVHLRRPQPAEAERRASARRCGGASRSCSRTRTPASTRASRSARRWSSRWPSTASAPAPAEREQRARALLDKVGLDGRAFGKYPHEFSGGQRQRIAIARCLTLNPEVLVLDEAVSALDVSVQAQVLNLLKDLQDEFGLAYVFISHDLAVVRFISDEVLVMKDGEVVEQAGAEQILAAPREDYTQRCSARSRAATAGPA